MSYNSNGVWQNYDSTVAQMILIGHSQYDECAICTVSKCKIFLIGKLHCWATHPPILSVCQAKQGCQMGSSKN